MNMIYDYETLGTNRKTSPVVCVAVLFYDEDRFLNNPYTFEELVNMTKLIKFDVTQQVKEYGRVIEKSTLDWWGSLPKKTQSLLIPKSDDVDIKDWFQIFRDMYIKHDVKYVYCRGNTFDNMVTDEIFSQFNQGIVYLWEKVRDTRSMIEGLIYGSGLKNYFVPEEFKDKFESHNPIHDVVMDVIRMQGAIRAISEIPLDDEIPF